ncbi:MAG: carboxypeptidase regulatory-like domain-containing protein [Pyrinomonadaceae bacterium]
MRHPDTRKDRIKFVSGVYTCLIACVFAVGAAVTTLAVPGDLDLTFGIGGKLTDWPGSARAKAVAIQPDGKIIVVGGYGTGVLDFRIARYNPDGTPDITFGGGTGRVTTDFGGLDDATNVVIQPDGRILVAGTSETNSLSQGGLALARYNTVGTLDTSFGGGSGKVHTVAPCFYAPYGRVGDVAIQSDGKIVGTVGMGDGDGNCENAAGLLVRYHPDGSLDTSFGTNGMVSTANALWSVTLQPANGKIVVVAGYWGLARFNANGSPDASFGAGGNVTLPPGSYSFGNSVVDSEGKIVAAGYTSYQGSPNIFSVFRFNANGSLDTTFDVDGTATTPMGSGFSFCSSVVIQANGRIVAAGTTNSDFALARYNPDGSLDSTFGGGDGITTVDFDNSSDSARDLALDSQGRAVVVGESNGMFAIARFLLNEAEVSISGRVTTSNGRGIGNAVVSVIDSLGVGRTARTSAFGYYSFSNIPSGTYNIAIRSKRYEFEPRTVFVDGILSGLDFVALN